MSDGLFKLSLRPGHLAFRSMSLVVRTTTNGVGKTKSSLGFPSPQIRL